MKILASLSLAGSVLAAVPSFGQTVAPSPYVVDATGKTMGPLLRGNQVILTLSSRLLVQTAFYQTGFKPPPDRSPGPLKLYFTTTNCTGTAYMNAEAFPPLAALNPAKPTDLAYPDVATVRIDYLSYKDITSSSVGCFSLTGSMLAGQARALLIDRMNFTPPFVIKLQ